jgi:hypothetical protein
MWQMRRIYLDAIGTPAGRFADVTLDLSDGRGRPLDSILWLRNGGGKSTIMALVGALIRPGRNDFLSASEHRNDAGRHLEDYVLGSDTAHVAVEWVESDGRRLVTGAVYEWADRVQPTDPTAQWQRLNQRFYSFVPDGDRAELARLPFRVSGQPTAQDAFCSQIRALPPAAEAVVARQQGEWAQTLTSRGIDPDLWRTILQMNESEGGIEHQFLFATPDDFVNYLLKLIVDPSIPDDVARILAQVSAELATRPAVEADLRFCVEATDRLTELDASWRTARDAAELVRIATADARLLKGSLMLAAEMASGEAQEAKEATETAMTEAARHRAAADAARDTGNEYARLAAVLRERAADARIAELDGQLAVATLDHDAWLIAPQLAEQFELGEQRKVLADRLAAAEQDAAPLAARRIETASSYAIALELLTESARRQVDESAAAIAAAKTAVETARGEHQGAIALIAELEATGKTLRANVARFETDLAAARAAGFVEATEEPAAASARLAATDEADAMREDELRSAIAEHETTVARDRAARDALSPQVERAKFDAESAARVRDELLARRDDLARDPRLAIYLPAEDADLIGMGRTISDAITAGITRADAAVMDLHLDGADDERARHAIESTGLLAPAPDLARALGVLLDAGVRAITGWTYLAEVVREPERQLAAFLAAPDLASGVLVQNPADLGRARELLGEAGLHPTSLVSVGTTAELQAAADRGEPGRPAVAPNVALFDPDRAAEDLARREAAEEQRGEQRARLVAERDQDRTLATRLSALLADCPPDRLAQLDANVEELNQVAAARTADLAALDDAIGASIATAAALRTDLRVVGERRRMTERARARVEPLVVAADAVARDREALAALPAQVSTARDAARAADEAERAAAANSTAAELRRQSLQTQLDGYAAARAALPAEVSTSDRSLDDGWSLDGLASAWETADEAWSSATIASPIAHELSAVTKREQRVRETLAAKRADVLAHAKVLLATPDGGTVATRERAAQAAAETVKTLTLAIGEVRHEKAAAHRDVENWEIRPDRQRHRVVDEPASVEEAQRLEQQYRAAQERETNARTTAEELARREEKRSAAALVRADAFADQAGRINVPHEEDAAVADEAFAGTVEEARRKAAEVSASLTALIADADRDRRKLDAVGNAITVWAGQDEWAAVKADVRSRFRTADVANELGSMAARFRDEEIDLRRIEIAEHLRTLDETRANVIAHAVGMVRQALRSIAKFSSLSKLPPDLGDWSGEKLIDVGPKTPVDDKDDAVMRDRVGRAVDSLITGQTATFAGMELLWRALREVVGPTGFRARVMKPSPSFSVERSPVERMRKWSGGEKVTMALLLFVTVARLRASNRGRDMAGAGGLMLDNPLGKASYAPFLALQRRVARSAGIQLVFLTGVADMRAVAQFPCVVRMRNAPDTARRRGYVQVTGRDLRDETEIARIDSTRVYRLDDEPTLTLA